jgi:hypothetical protein
MVAKQLRQMLGINITGGAVNNNTAIGQADDSVATLQC